MMSSHPQRFLLARPVHRVLLGCLLAIAISSAGHAQRELVVEIVAGDPGQTVFVNVTFTGDGTVTGLQFDLSFDSDFLTVGTPASGPALTDHDLDTEILTPGILRILVHSSTNDILGNGIVVALPFTIDSTTPDGFYPIDRSGVVMGNPIALSVTPTLLVSGGIQVGAGGCIAPDNVVLDNQIVTGTQTFEACQTITTGPSFGIAPPADITLRAGVEVVLDNGTSFGEGVTVTIEIDPALNSAVSEEDR
jgi:hypothetical protein